ncbi:hypothetical protein [Ferrimonas marina]|uniref:Uncharacterized protein n=1 Tax=Ferrimonas marina TaxID=299255 RepID=A0A1M5S9C0_9GAMM|nr:hypothetical protein [Ferrimonas marina]SHH35096.1 hypothetical protein SAMN02745129_1917 [Ferrimonas marina]
MLSQSLPAQLARWLLLLLLTLVAVHHCQPLLDALARDAVSAGCHSMEPGQEHAQEHATDHHHHHHHHGHH